MSDLSIENTHLITAILRYLVDEKKLLTQEDVDAILTMGEQNRQRAEEGFAEYQAATPAERRKKSRLLQSVSDDDGQ